MRGREERLDRPGTARVARYREPGRRLQRGSRKKTRWEASRPATKRATQLMAAPSPGAEAPDQPAARPSALRPETGTRPPRRVLRVPLSHLDSGEGPAQGHRAKRWRRWIRTGPRSQNRSPRAVTEVHLLDAIPRAEPGCGPAGGRGRGGVWEPVKEAELSSPPARSSLTRPCAGPGSPARLQVPEAAARRGRGGGRAARTRGDVTSRISLPCRSSLAASGRLRARGLTGISPHTGRPERWWRADSSPRRAPRAGGVLTAGREARPGGERSSRGRRRRGGGEGGREGAHTLPLPAAPSPSPDVNWVPLSPCVRHIGSNSGQRRRRAPAGFRRRSRPAAAPQLPPACARPEATPRSALPPALARHGPARARPAAASASRLPRPPPPPAAPRPLRAPPRPPAMSPADAKRGAAPEQAGRRRRLGRGQRRRGRRQGAGLAAALRGPRPRAWRPRRRGGGGGGGGQRAPRRGQGRRRPRRLL